MIQAFRIGINPPGENITTSGATAANGSVTCPDGRNLVRVVATNGAARVAVGATAIATSTSVYLPEGAVEYFLCDPGARVSVIRPASTDVTVGVTFLTR